MKPVLCLLCIATLAALFACNNASNETAGPGKPKTLTDSLMDDVMEGHNVGMSKMGKLTKFEQQTQRMIDSIGKLPAKAREAAAPYKVKLDSLLKELQYADFAMNKWMEEFNMDSALNDIKERTRYLEEEREKVTTIKGAILNSLRNADSVLRSKL